MANASEPRIRVIVTQGRQEGNSYRRAMNGGAGGYYQRTRRGYRGVALVPSADGRGQPEYVRCGHVHSKRRTAWECGYRMAQRIGTAEGLPVSDYRPVGC